MSFLAVVVVTYLLGADSVSSDKDYLDEWFDQVVLNFNDQLIDYGISNLKVNNVSLDVNRTLVPGLHLEGRVSYLSGVVADLEQLQPIVDGHKGGVDENGAQLFYQINLPNMTIFCDVDVQLKDQDAGQGTAELFWANTTVGFYFTMDYNTGDQDVRVETFTTQGPATNFQPSTDLMNVVARLARLELGYRLLWDQVNYWCQKVFLEMLTKAVQQTPFPIVPPPEDPSGTFIREGGNQV